MPSGLSIAGGGRLHLLPGGRIGLSSRRAQIRAAWGALLYLMLAGWVMRGAARLGRRPTLHRVERLWARRLRSFLRIDLELSGLEQVDPGHRYLVLPLHEGFADALALLHLPLDLRFLARDELFEWPLLGRHLRATGQLLVQSGRRSGLRQLLSEGRRALDSGESLVVFPQGSILGVETAFRPGALRLIQALGHPVLPVVLSGTHRVWEYPYSPRLRFGCPVTMRVLPPRAARSLDETSFRELEREMKRLALGDRRAPPRRFDPERDGYWDGYDFQIDPDFPEIHRMVEEHRRGYPSESAAFRSPSGSSTKIRR